MTFERRFWRRFRVCEDAAAVCDFVFSSESELWWRNDESASNASEANLSMDSQKGWGFSEVDAGLKPSPGEWTPFEDDVDEVSTSKLVLLTSGCTAQDMRSASAAASAYVIAVSSSIAAVVHSRNV